MKLFVAPIIISIGLATQVIPAQAQNNPTAVIDGRSYIYKDGQTFEINSNELTPVNPPSEVPTAVIDGRSYIYKDGQTFEVNSNELTPVNPPSE